MDTWKQEHFRCSIRGVKKAVNVMTGLKRGRATVLKTILKSVFKNEKLKLEEERERGVRDGVKRRRIEEDDGDGFRAEEEPSFQQRDDGGSRRGRPRNRLHGLCEQIQE